MDFSGIYVCVFCLSMIQMGQPQIFINPSGLMTIDDIRYQPQQAIYPFNLTRQLSKEFLDLLKLINKSQFSAPLIKIRDELHNLVVNNKIEVARIMNYAKSFKDISKFDRMIVALFALRDTLSQTCEIRQDLRKIILYSIFNKDKFNSVVHPYDQICQEVAVSINPNQQCQILCEKLQVLPRTCRIEYSNTFIPKRESNYLHSSPFDMPLLKNIQGINNRIEPNTNISISSQIDRLTNTLPDVEFDDEERKHDILTKLFQTQEVSEFLKNIDPAKIDDKSLLKSVLKHIASRNVSKSTEEAVNYYINYDQNFLKNLRNKYDFASLINFLPEPINKEEEEYFRTAVLFLNGTDIYHTFKSIDLPVNIDKKSLYKAVIALIAESKELDDKIKNAFNYYSNYEDYDDIEFFTKQVILKNFKLIKMFKHVLNSDSLDESVSNKLKIFLRYLSKSGYLLTNFEIPTNVHTQAEFIIAVFNYLLSNSEVPPSIQSIIEILKPHVIFTGEGSVLI